VYARHDIIIAEILSYYTGNRLENTASLRAVFLNENERHDVVLVRNNEAVVEVERR